MKRRRVFRTIFFLFLLGNLCYADPIITFEKTFGGGERDWDYSVEQTSDGDYIICCSTRSIGFDNYDIYLIKTDNRGNKLWEKILGGSDYDVGCSVKQTNDGGYIIGGATKSFGAGNYDVYLIKTDNRGNKLWEKTFGGSNYDVGRSVEQTSDGGYIICGYTRSYSYYGDPDVYLIKTDNRGNKLWEKTFGGSEADGGYSVVQTANGGYIICGYTRSFSYGELNVYLIKTDNQGNKLWEKNISNPVIHDLYSVNLTDDGGYIVCCNANFPSMGGPEYGDVFIIKADSQGEILWIKAFGGGSMDLGKSAKQTTDGGYIICGETQSFRDSGTDLYLIKTDKRGNKLWEKTFGGGGAYGHSVNQTNDGGYIICGYTISFGAFRSGVYLIKTDSQGNVAE